jgi:hypothetical protein
MTTTSQELPERPDPPGGQAKPEWLSQTESALQGLLRLPSGWDSYGAHPINPDIVHAANRLLREIARRDTPQPVVVPTVRGGVQIEWHTGGIDLEIDFLSPEKAHASYEDPERNVEQEFDLHSGPTELQGLIARLSNVG